MMEGKLLLPEEVLEQWPAISPFIDSFLKRGQGTSTVFDIAQKCISMKYQCWVVTQNTDIICVCITKIDEYPEFNSLHIIGIAGKDMSVWQHFHPTLENFAKFNKCNRITQWGRAGWAKRLEDLEGQYGEKYKVIHTVMAMELQTDKVI